MKTSISAIVVLVLIGAVVIIAGCSTIQNILPKRCSTTCNDHNACTKDICNAQTNYTCVHTLIKPCNGNGICEPGEYLTSTDCPNCDDGNKCTIDGYNYNTSSCTHQIIPNCCGNGICEANETYATCPADCPSCNDHNACTRDTYNRQTGTCSHTVIVPCCGNGICESSESYSTCPQDCPPTEQDQARMCMGNDTCFANVAVKFDDVSLCRSAITTTGTDKCYMAMALNTSNSFLCGLISDPQTLHDCQQEYAIRAKDPSKCPTVNPNNCFESIAIETHQTGVCSLMVEEFVNTRADFITECKAVVTDNPLTCKGITNTWIADKCYQQIAIARKDPSLCNAVVLDPQTCQYYVEQALSVQ